MQSIRYLSGFAVLLTPLAAHAADAGDNAADTRITVVATGLAQPVDQSGQAISVVGVDEIVSVQGPDITRVLSRLPGVEIARNGGLGSLTSVFIRGAESAQTLVLVDGARVADVSSPASGFDFGTLLSGNIEKIELLRGSNSVAWGSDAIGGVIAVTTRQIDGLEASAEYGSDNAFTGTMAGGFTAGGLSLSLNGGYARSDGFPQMTKYTKPDGFDQWQGGGRATYDLGSGLSAFVDARYARSRVDVDYSFADDYTQTTKQASGRTGLRYTSDSLDLTAAYSLSDTHRLYAHPTYGSYYYDGVGQLAELDGKWHVRPGVALLFGASHDWTRYRGTYDSRQSARQTSAHALLDVTAGGLNLAGGVRLDHHSQFGDAWTFGANGSLEVGGGWRVRASYGQGFKAPTLYQLYSYSGNLALRPERSDAYEAGIEHGDRNGPLHFGASVFRRDSRNLIDYDYAANGGFGGYVNVNRTRATGVEIEGDVRPTDRFALRAAYTYVKSINRDTGEDLLRRPRNTLSASVDWITPLHGLSVGGDITFASASRDLDPGLSPVRLEGYAIGTLRASIPVNEHFELYGRIENVTDEKYQTVYGYNTQGRAAFVGVRARI